MIRLKDFVDDLSACQIYGCDSESAKIWANKEVSIIDVCDKHYKELMGKNK